MEIAASVDSITPPLSLLVRGKRCMYGYAMRCDDSYKPTVAEQAIAIPDVSGALTTTIGSVNSLKPVYSPQGDMFAIVEGGPSSVITLVKASLASPLETVKLCDIPVPELGADPVFSPRGAYLVTWSLYRAHKSAGMESESSNLRVWRILSDSRKSIDDGLDVTLVTSFSLKVYKENTVQFSSDERYLFHSVSNEIHVYLVQSSDKPMLVSKIVHKNLSQFMITNVLASPLRDGTEVSYINVAVFVPEIGGKPASTTVYRFVCSKDDGKGDEASAKATDDSSKGVTKIGFRNMFAASEAHLLWNSRGDTLLAHTHSDVDRSNSSYYGSSGLFYLKIKGGSFGDESKDGLVSSSKEGPVHDVKWCPLGDKFVVCAGNMPSQSTMFNDNVEPIFEFGTAHRNTISWSPHGRFLILAGFGNLAGEIDFYDGLRMRKIGSNSAHATGAFGWSPDSRYFLSATVSPRMNVDNGFKIFKYNGIGPVYSRSYDTIYDVLWKAVPSALYPSRGLSPKREDALTNEKVSTSAASGVYRPPAYRPPGAGGSQSSAFAELYERESGPVGKVKKGSTPAPPAPASTAKYTPKPRAIPGMPTPPPAPSVKPAPNTAKTSQKSNGGSATAKSSSSAVATSSASSAAKSPSESTPVPSSTLSTATASAAATGTSSEEDLDKRIKNVRKKLKQIEEIKSKAQALNDDQRAKLASESSLIEELNKLTLQQEGNK